MTKKELFTDNSFPANKASLYSNDVIPASEPQVSWRRLENYVAEGTDLTEGACSGDVLQGSLGDCWLLASIAAIADTPALIQRIFRTPRANAEGRYALRLAVDGLSHDVEVDSLLPFTDPAAGTLYSARQHHGRFWVALLEKALAKVAGGYDRLDSGDCEEALRTFTGCPTASLESHVEPEAFWRQLAGYGRSGRHLLTCGIDPLQLAPALRAAVTPDNLLLNHVYTVLAADEHRPSGTRLLRLRNPWGRAEYRGPFSDGSGRWTPELRAFFRPAEDPGDGVFFMAFDDFRRHFNVVSVCYLAPRGQSAWCAARVPSFLRRAGGRVDSPTLELTLQRAGAVHLALHQLDEREKGALRPVDAGAVVASAATGEAEGLLGVRYRRVVQQKLRLPAGTFHVVPYSSGVHLGAADERPLAVTAHSAPEVAASLRRLAVEGGRADEALARAVLRLGSAPVVSGDDMLQVRTLSTRDLMVVAISAGDKAGPGRNLVALFDPSKSTNIVPTLNSLPSMKPIHLLLDQKSGMVVNKFIRTGNEAYEFNLQVTFLGYTDRENEGSESFENTLAGEKGGVFNRIKENGGRIAQRKDGGEFGPVKVAVAALVI